MQWKPFLLGAAFGDTLPKSSDQLITELLQAAMSAPSAANEQPWHFHVIDDTRFWARSQSSILFLDAPRSSIAIFVCVERIPGREGSVVQDGSAATQNLLLAAHAKGLALSGLGSTPLKNGSKACDN